MFPAVYHYIFVLIADKQVDPINNSEGYKIKLILIVEFVFSSWYFKNTLLKDRMQKTCTMLWRLPVSGARAQRFRPLRCIRA
jgi:hypothetical protein